MSLSDTEMSVVAALGACALAAALSVPTLFGNGFAGCGGSGKSDEDDTKEEKHTVINASLAMKAEKKTQPQKQFRQDEPDKTVGVNNDPTKVVVKQCCTSEKDCNDAGLAFPTTCAGDLLCENNRCLKPKRQRPDNPDPTNVIPDRTGNIDDPSGKPTPNTIGAFDGSKHGLAKSNSGDPYLALLFNDFLSLIEFPKLEQASAAQPCIRLTKDGVISDTEFLPKYRSDNEGLNGQIEIALKKLKDQRTQKPQPVPDRLNSILSEWTCFPVNNQTRQD